MPLYYRGRKAYYGGKLNTISHVLITRKGLYVHFDEHEHPVPSEQVDMECIELMWPTDRLGPSPQRAPETDSPHELTEQELFEQALA